MENYYFYTIYHSQTGFISIRMTNDYLGMFTVLTSETLLNSNLLGLTRKNKNIYI